MDEDVRKKGMIIMTTMKCCELDLNSMRKWRPRESVYRRERERRKEKRVVHL